MKTLIPTILLLVSFIPVCAQFDSLRFASYNLGDFKRSQLDLSMQLNATYGQNEARNQFLPTRSQSKSSISGVWNIDYQHTRNTRSVQRWVRVYTNLNHARTTQKSRENQTSPLHNSRFINQNTLSTINRLYNSNKRFLELNLNADWDYYTESWDYDTLFRSFTRQNLSISPAVYLGTGRIEQVQDARLAVYIMEDLYKKNKINRIPSHEELMAISALITRLKNRRFFDFRLQKIYELEQLDSLLSEYDLISQKDMVYFTRVSDNWNYSDRPVRMAGRRLSIGIEPFFNRLKSLEEKESLSVPPLSLDEVSYFYGWGSYIQYNWEKPISLCRQNSFNAYMGLVSSTSREIVQSVHSDPVENAYLHGELAYAYGLYPNSRIDILAQLSFNFAANLDEIRQISVESVNLRPQFLLDINYYISPEFRLNSNARIFYSYGATFQNFPPTGPPLSENKAFSTSWNLGLLYSIF